MAVVCVLLASFSARSPASRLTLIELPEKPSAPPFALVGTDGKTYTLKQYQGQVLVVNFWATWCEPCRREFPAMDRVMHQLADQPIRFIAINVGDSPAAIRKFLSVQPVSMPVLLDQQSETSAAWQVQGMPTTYVVAPDGKIFYGAIGERDWSNGALISQLESLARR